MGCCGDREKGKTVAEDQKWDYIVRDYNILTEVLILTVIEPTRLQIDLVSCTLLLRLVVASRHCFLCHLRRRCFHRSQSPGLQ